MWVGFSNTENVSNQPTNLETQYASLKHYGDGEVSPERNNTLHINYANADYFSSHPATFIRQDNSKKMTEVFHTSDDPHQAFPIMSTALFTKNKFANENSIKILSTCLGKTV